MMRFKWYVVFISLILLSIGLWFFWGKSSNVEQIDESEESSARKESQKLPEELSQWPELTAESKPEKSKSDDSVKTLDEGMKVLMEQGVNMLYTDVYDELKLSESTRKEMTNLVLEQASESMKLAMMLGNENISSSEILELQAQQKAQKRHNLEKILGNEKDVEAVERFEKTVPQRQSELQADLQLKQFKSQLSPEDYARLRSRVVEVDTRIANSFFGKELNAENIDAIRKNPNAIIQEMIESKKQEDKVLRQALLADGLSSATVDELIRQRSTGP